MGLPQVGDQLIDLNCMLEFRGEFAHLRQPPSGESVVLGGGSRDASRKFGIWVVDRKLFRGGAMRLTRGKPAAERKAAGRLVEGRVVTNWKQALAQPALAYPERINHHL